LLFQTLDSKNECAGYYVDGKFFYDHPVVPLTKTWDYSHTLRHHEVEYARVYCGGKTLSEACPPAYQNLWSQVKKQLNAYFKAIRTSQVRLDEVCLFEVLPESFLFELCDIKNEISKSVFAEKSRPQNFRLFANILKLLGDIRTQPLSINLDAIRHKGASIQGRNFIQRVRQGRRICDYNPWGTITGRLSTNPNSFPIMTMKKEFRRCLEPRNDWFVELDYNAAEVRTLLALADQEQPEGDIHEWNMKHIYTDGINREEAKRKIFAWLYSRRSNKKAEAYYDKNLVLEKYWKDGIIETEFDRVIENVDEHHALNYIVQSTTSDLVLSKAVDINERVYELSTNVAFTLHDSIVLDLKNEDRYLLPELIKMFGDTKFGKYKVNIAAGKNFGEMKGMNL